MWKIWNGIHTDGNRSVAGRLRKYSASVAVISVLICLTAVFFLLAYSGIYSRLTDSNLWLQDLYAAVEQAGEAAEDYAFLGEEESRILYQKTRNEISENFDSLSSLKIEGNYRRNLEDLKILMEKYQGSAEKLMLLSEKENIYGESDEPGDMRREAECLDQLGQAMLQKRTVFQQEIYTYLYQERRNLQKDMFRMAGFLFFILLSGVLLMICGTGKLSDNIIRPLEKIAESARAIQRYHFGQISEEENEEDLLGNTAESLREIDQAPREVALLQDVFCKMLLCIRQQVSELKENMKLREKLNKVEMENLQISNMLTTSELKCLQTQINPHFLFNTLNMIQQTIYLDKKEKTSLLLKETAAFLRYSLDYAGKTVTLQQELEAAGNYVSLQEERMGERVLFEFELDESIRSIKVPSLIIQPLIENSLIHGVGDYFEGGLIRVITAYDRERHLAVIRIWDNGHGVSEEELQELQGQMKQIQMIPDGKIGLENVCKRLLILTGYQSRMEIESRQGEYFAVNILIPWEAEENHDKGGNRG